MIYLNYNNLDKETQDQLMRRSMVEIEQRHGVALKKYARTNRIAYQALLEEEAIRNLYNYKFEFRI